MFTSVYKSTNVTNIWETGTQQRDSSEFVHTHSYRVCIYLFCAAVSKEKCLVFAEVPSLTSVWVVYELLQRLDQESGSSQRPLVLWGAAAALSTWIFCFESVRSMYRTLTRFKQMKLHYVIMFLDRWTHE